jgi:hypothetical protein
MNRAEKVRLARRLVRMAKGLMAGCEKLPKGPMRDNCEKKKKDKKASRNRQAAVGVKVDLEFGDELDAQLFYNKHKSGNMLKIRGENVTGELMAKNLRDVSRDLELDYKFANIAAYLEGSYY